MTEKNKFAVVVLPEVIACACADFSRDFFLTIVVVQNVGNVEPLSAVDRWLEVSTLHITPPIYHTRG
jgi:hypothetical protein